jgi:hypothetical protein
MLLAGLAAAVAGVGAAGFGRFPRAEAAVTPGRFLDLSKALTGTADLDAGIADVLLAGFLAAGSGPGLARLAANGGKASGRDADLANAVVAAWYSGIYDTGHGQAVASFDQALMWRALTFTKPFGECGGDTGYWADPPQG